MIAEKTKSENKLENTDICLARSISSVCKSMFNQVCRILLASFILVTIGRLELNILYSINPLREVEDAFSPSQTYKPDQ